MGSPGSTPGERAQYLYDSAGNIIQVVSSVAPGLTISDFSPRVGGVGDIVTVYGSGFYLEPSDPVTLGGLRATVVWSTPTEIAIVVPAGAGSGKISVTAGGNSAASLADFTVVQGVVVSDFTPKLGSAGTVLTVTGYNFAANPASNTVAMGDGSAEVTSASTNWLVATVGSTATSGKVRVTSPVGIGMSAEDFFVIPGGYSDAEVGFAARQPPGAPTDIDLAEPGKIGLLIFDGTAGERITVLVGETAFSAELEIFTPTGSSHFLQPLSPASGDRKVVPPVLPASGTYTLLVKPGSGAVGQLRVQVLPQPKAALTPGSATSMALSRGQNGWLTFDATAGDRLSFACTAIQTDPAGSSVSISVWAPNGTYVYESTVTAPMSAQLPALTQTGTHVMLVRPAGVAAASLTLLLSRPGVGSISVDGEPGLFQNVNPGQGARYLFAANAADRLSFGLNSLTTAPANGYITFRVYDSADRVIYGNTISGAYGMQLPSLPTSGAYTLEILPSGTSMVSATFVLSRAITGTIATDGTPTTYQTTRAGQAGRYTFSGTTGQRFTMQATAGSYTGSVGVTVYQPNGSSIGSATLTTAVDRKIDLGSLPASGVYTVEVVPPGVALGPVTLRLVSVATDALVVGDPSKTLALGAAQNGRYTFAGDAGDLLGLAVTAFSTTPAGGYVNLYVYKPDGTILWTGSASFATSFQLPQLPAAGTYILTVTPDGTKAASLTVLLSQTILGTLSPDGAATTYETTRAGQAGRYTFSGTSGQQLTMQATAGTYSGTIGVTVYHPNGVTIIRSAQLSSAANTKMDLGSLPVSGVYTVAVVPQGLTVGQVTLRLQSKATDTLVVGDPAKTLVLGAAQNGWYTFSGNSGAYLGLALTALSTTPVESVNLYVYKPDGTMLWFDYASSPRSYQLPRLPVTGTYSLAVSPTGTTTSATLTVLLSEAISGTLSTAGASTIYETTRAGQAGRYTFSGIAGQRFTMRATAGSFSGTMNVTVYQPNGASIGSAQLTSGADAAPWRGRRRSCGPARRGRAWRAC